MFFDAHTHAHFAAFENDWKDVIDRALRSGVWLTNVGTQYDTSKRGVEVAREYEKGVYAAIGLHPVHTSRSYHDASELGGGEEAKGFTSRGEEFDYEKYLSLGRDPKVVAIGECGLDYFRIEGDIEENKRKQHAAFDLQISLAKELQKPLMIHCRNAFPDLIAMLKARRSDLLVTDPGIIHFFTGTPEDAAELLGLGFSFTFGGVVTFARDYDQAIANIPKEHLLSETDAPYVAPLPYRGKRNEPAYVGEVVRKLAELKGLARGEMENATFENARRVFRLTDLPA